MNLDVVHTLINIFNMSLLLCLILRKKPSCVTTLNFDDLEITSKIEKKKENTSKC